jgi:hypothetical protein
VLKIIIPKPSRHHPVIQSWLFSSTDAPLAITRHPRLFERQFDKMESDWNLSSGQIDDQRK